MIKAIRNMAVLAVGAFALVQAEQIHGAADAVSSGWVTEKL